MNDKSPNLHKKERPLRIQFIVATRLNCANNIHEKISRL